MQMKIRKDGNLEINRAGVWKEQRCLIGNKCGYCGDSCPLFGEPDKEFNYETKQEMDALKLCHTTLYGVIIDARQKQA